MKKLFLMFSILAGMQVQAQQIFAPTASVGTSSTLNSVGIGTQTPLTGFGVNLLGGIGRPITQGLYIQRSDNPATNQDGGLKIFFSSAAFTGGGGLAGGSCAFQLVPTPNSVAPDMAFSCNNTLPQMTIKNNGKVGIGTSTPVELLDVKGTTRTVNFKMTGSNPATGYIMTSSNNAGLATWTSPSAVFGNLTANMIPKWGTTSFVDTKVIELPGGNIGINTLTPVNKLEIAVTVPEDGIRVTQLGGGFNGAAALHLKNNTAGGKMWSFYSMGSGNTIEGSGNFVIQESDNLGVNNFQRLIIQKTTGNVGIGTLTPNDKVEINSGVTAHSGLRFTQLNSNTSTTATPGDFNCNKVLSVDANGEVILVDLSSCGSSSKQGSDAFEFSDQQAQIDDLKNQIAELKAIIGYSSSFSAKTGATEKASLLQISPNPLSQHATVSYSLPAGVSGAQLSITDASGKVAGTYSLSAGSTEQVIDATKLVAGVYQYSLIVNGKMTDSKQMVIVK